MTYQRRWSSSPLVPDAALADARLVERAGWSTLAGLRGALPDGRTRRIHNRFLAEDGQVTADA